MQRVEYNLVYCIFASKKDEQHFIDGLIVSFLSRTFDDL